MIDFIIREKTSFILLVFSLVLILLTIFSEFWLLFVLYACLTVISSLVYPVIGATIWFMLAPFEAIAVVEWGISPYLMVTPAFLIGASVHILMNPKFKLKYNILFLSSGFIISILISLLFSIDFGIRSFISIGLLVLCTAVSILAVYNDSRRSFFLLIGIVMSSLCALLYSISIWDGWWRLTLVHGWGGGVRHLDSILSISVAICFSILLTNNKRLYNKFEIKNGKPFRLSILIIIIILLAGLLATVSRGSIIALISGLIVVFLLFGIKISARGLLPSGLPILLCCIFVISFFYPVIDTFFTKEHLNNRFLLFLSDIGGNARWDLWRSSFSSLDGYEWYFGRGPGSFGIIYDASPHSVYVNAIIEIGFFGFCLILLNIFLISFVGAIHAGIPVIFYIVYFTSSFLTKGSLYDKYFYFSFVIAWTLMETIKTLNTKYNSDRIE